MEVTALCIRLLMFVTVLLSAHIQESFSQKDDATFRVTVNRLQFFEYESVSFHCETWDDSTQLRGTNEELNADCEVKKTSTLTCTIKEAYESDSGVYWCETDGGEKSNTVNVTVTAGPVILESPAVPVLEGDDVTLHCREKTKSVNHQADFYKDGVIMEKSPAEKIMIDSFSKSDEGLYTCSIPDVGASPESWLTVGENNPSHHVSSDIFITLWVTIFLMALVLLPVGLIYIRKHGVDASIFHPSLFLCFTSSTPTAATHSEVDNQIVSGNDSADDPNTLTYAVVFTKPRKNKADAAHNTSLHLERNHSRKPQVEGDKEPVYSTVNIKRTKKMER